MMSQLCLLLDVSRPGLVCRYIQILTKLRHPFMDEGITTVSTMAGSTWMQLANERTKYSSMNSLINELVDRIWT
jgi:hypothetical protein